MKTTLLMLAAAILMSACGGKQAKQEEWIQLFNGENLEGWTVKITGYPAGENFGNTFRVEDGILKVRYDAYDEFNDRFGHLITDGEYSDYILRVEYRILDDQVPGAPEWAYRNSGAMLLSQSAESMRLEQDFPVSIEAQFLGGDGTGERPTGSACTPSTDIYVDGELYTPHILPSNGKTYDGDRWVTMDMVVRSNGMSYHIVEGDTVVTYSRPIVNEEGIINNVQPGPLKKGHIAMQSEGHPVDFRKVELLLLPAE